MTDTPGKLEERGDYSHEAVQSMIAGAIAEAADEIASLRARVGVMRETCARIAERDADRSNAVFEAGIGGDAGKDRNAARYRTALRIARAIRDTPVE